MSSGSVDAEMEKHPVQRRIRTIWELSLRTAKITCTNCDHLNPLPFLPKIISTLATTIDDKGIAKA